jgi:hypothetical protein
MRVTSMSVAISLSAYVMIACLFGPKLYIILFHPERNVRQSMMGPNAGGGGGGGRYTTGTTACATLPSQHQIQMTSLKENHLPLNLTMTTGNNKQLIVQKVDASTSTTNESYGE